LSAARPALRITVRSLPSTELPKIGPSEMSRRTRLLMMVPWSLGMEGAA
jgi:hypothetical protein